MNISTMNKIKKWLVNNIALPVLLALACLLISLAVYGVVESIKWILNL